eukprot:11183277-Lingulodinium_polyedra.AAC.1
MEKPTGLSFGSSPPSTTARRRSCQQYDALGTGPRARHCGPSLPEPATSTAATTLSFVSPAE